jgi:hypothetical protein
MFSLTRTTRRRRDPELIARPVVVLVGDRDTGIEAAGSARAEDADVITVAFEADDHAGLEDFFDGLPGPVDRVVVAPGGPNALAVARSAVAKMRPGGTLVLNAGPDRQFAGALAVALAPVRIRVVVADGVEGRRPLLARAA